MERSGDGPVSGAANDEWILDVTRTFTLRPDKCALVVVDMQYAAGSRTMGLGKLAAARGRLGELEYRFSRIEKVVIPNVKRLIEYFRRSQLRIVYLTIGATRPDLLDVPIHLRGMFSALGNVEGNPEHEILKELAPQPDEAVVNKTTLSAFNSTHVELVLRNICVEDCVFVGVATNMCVEGTARDASDRGFNCLIVEDGCAADNPIYHEVSLRNFQRLYGRVASTEEVIAELNRSWRSKESIVSSD